MFENIHSLEDLYNTFGGQRRHGIITPAGYPHIFLIHSTRNTVYEDDLDYNHSNGDFVRFAYEGKGDDTKYGNRAVLNHKNTTSNSLSVYRSLFLFENDDTNLTYIGEYELERTETNRVNNKDQKCFILKRVSTDFDSTSVFYVEKTNEDGSFIRSSLGSLTGYYLKDETEKNIPEVINNKPSVQEGSYVTRNNDIIDQSIDSAESRKANQNTFIINNRNRVLRRRAKNKTPYPLPQNITNAYFYCIYTGCGKTSFLVLQMNKETEIWCFDLGAEKSSYDNNVNTCINYIKNKFSLSEFKIKRLFISHPHSDHISLISQNLLDPTCEIWLDTWIKKGSKLYGKNLTLFRNENYKIIETQKNNSINGIRILHPQEPIGYGFDKEEKSPPYTTKNVNNTSPIIEVKILDKTILFTGDIEKEGWSHYITNQTGPLKENIYIHSHHGSKTGFYLDAAKTKNIYNYFNISDFQIIFTRVAAHHNILSPDIEKLNTQPSKIYKTEDLVNSVAYEIDLKTNSINLI